MRALLQDVRYGIRALRKTPGFTVTAVLLLGLGIGANAAIFSLVHGVLLKPLPFAEPGRIVSVPHVPPQDIFPGAKTFAVSPANYLDWKAQNDVFSKMTIFSGDSLTLTGLGRPEALDAGIVSADFFAVLGVLPLVGRLFQDGDDAPGRHVAVLSEGLWKDRFGASPAAVGTVAILNGGPYTIVGVLPERATYPEGVRLWVPLSFSPQERAVRGIHDYSVLARLKPGVSLEAARSRMSAISARLAAQYPEDDRGWGAAVIPLHEDLVGDVRPALLILLGAVAFVLLIACANVANLLLARALGRRKEIAVRVALGASRARIVRQLFVETMLVALAGGALGLVLARGTVSVLVAAVADQMPRAAEIRVDAAVLLFGLGVSLVTGALAGLLPAWRLTRADPNDALKQGGRSESDAGSPAIRNTLVVAEVALALLLMAGAGLLVRSLGRLRSVAPGFDPEHVLTAFVSIPEQKYVTPESRRAFHERLLESVRALPGVTSAGAINTLPLTDGGSTQPVTIEGRAAARLSEQPEVAVRVVMPDTWKTLRVRVLAGRDFTAADRDGAAPVVMVSDAMARKFWPGESAVGKRLTLTFYPGVSREVVGVVADVKLRGLARREPIAALYVPHSQMPRTGQWLLVRTGPDPSSLARAVESAVHSLDPDQPVVALGTLKQHLRDSLAHARFNTGLLTAFAGLALLLSAAGIYSVLAYSVRRRTREIGIRLALGADTPDVVRLVVVQGMKPALAGLGLGIGGALILGRAMSSLVFGISATDPGTFAAAAGILGLVALAACALPAFRASRVAPTVALTEG